jgi:hypothetical protein
MQIGKLAALLLVLAYVIAGWISAGLSFAALVAAAALLPLVLIWFPDEIDSWVRSWRQGGAPALHMRPSPGWLIAAMGWVFLVGLPLLLLLLQRQDHQ